MRLFNRESRLESLERQSAAVNAQIQKLKAELEALCDAQHIDPVLKLWLQKRYGFDYAEERAIYEKILREKQALICELQKEKEKLQGELNDEIWIQRLKQKDIRFYGENVVGFEGSVVKLRCPWCKTQRMFDARNSVALQTILSATSAEELQAAYSLGNTIGVECGNILKNGPRCGFTFEVKIARIKI
jgi:glutaredoxin